MVPSIRDSSGDNYHASYSRADDWNACCARAMGFDDGEDWAVVDVLGEDSSTGGQPKLQVTNLLPSALFEDDNDKEEEDNHKSVTDPWTENAMNIQADLERMSQWIHSKKWLFISFDSMEDVEASLIQSTVTSFAATTANEIESLRKMTLQASAQLNSSNRMHHRNGIVQILLAKLKEEIVEPFGMLQKHRSREAVRLWQNPLQCKLLVKRRPKAVKKQRDEIDEALGLDDIVDDPQEEIEKSRREQRFMPSREAHQLRQNFMDTYQRDQQITKTSLKRPESFVKDPLSALSSENESVFQANPTSEDQTAELPQQQRRDHHHTSLGGTATSTMQPMPTGWADYQLEEMSDAQHQQMQQEAQLLQTMVHSDLDSVQKMEQQMVSITSLLTQFSELVSEQQEEVWHIHDTAKETKDNMDKGQETLVDAAEKTHNSKHYMAKGIFALGCLLLLFHWLCP